MSSSKYCKLQQNRVDLNNNEKCTTYIIYNGIPLRKKLLLDLAKYHIIKIYHKYHRNLIGIS